MYRFLCGLSFLYSRRHWFMELPHDTAVWNAGRLDFSSAFQNVLLVPKHMRSLISLSFHSHKAASLTVHPQSNNSNSQVSHKCCQFLDCLLLLVTGWAADDLQLLRLCLLSVSWRFLHLHTVCLQLWPLNTHHKLNEDQMLYLMDRKGFFTI